MALENIRQSILYGVKRTYSSLQNTAVRSGDKSGVNSNKTLFTIEAGRVQSDRRLVCGNVHVK